MWCWFYDLIYEQLCIYKTRPLLSRFVLPKIQLNFGAEHFSGIEAIGSATLVSSSYVIATCVSWGVRIDAK